MLDLVRSVDQPFTVGTLVRAAERDGVSVSAALRWLRDAEGDAVDRHRRRAARRPTPCAAHGCTAYAADAYTTSVPG